MSTEPAKKRAMPRGGKKGGTMFPRVSLADALIYARKLVSKTHTGPQPRDVILMGVIGSKHDKGELGMSALKQYGLMKGDTKLNFSAEELAKKIAAAPSDEAIPLYRKAALKPAVFKSLFDTFHSDTVSKAKIRQRAHDLKVHPDETGNCVDLYLSSMATAELVVVAGEQVTHVASADATSLAVAANDGAEGAAMDAAERASEEPSNPPSDGSGAEGTEVTSLADSRAKVPAPRAVFNVNVTLDSSLDIEKLQKQLELLRRYGAL